MKKLTLGIVAALSLAASAAWQKAGSIQVADAQAFTKAVMKLGEISGNQMLGALAAGFLAEPPGSKFFGPMRPGSTALIATDGVAVEKEDGWLRELLKNSQEDMKGLAKTALRAAEEQYGAADDMTVIAVRLDKRA